LTPPRRILIIDDSPQLANVLARPLRTDKWVVDVAPNRDAAFTLLAAEDPAPYAIAFVDYNLGSYDYNGVDVVSAIAKHHRHIYIIAITGEANADVAVAMLNAGAQEFTQRLQDAKLIVAMAERKYQYLLNSALTRAAPDNSGTTLVREFSVDENQKFIGTGPRMEAMFRRIRTFAKNPFPLLIVGESGTGKELVARKIHTESGRPIKNYFALNSGAIAESLIESELFGHDKFAFTGAGAKPHPGVFRAVSGGTLFLDEVNSLPLTAQVKFLRAIQNREVTAIGTTTPVAIDTRVLAASNVDLKAAVEAGRFRADLYHRLAVFIIEIPPLRDRREDLPMLTWHFIQVHQKVWDLNITAIHPRVSEILQDHDWRANNVRELESVVQRALAMAAAAGTSEIVEEMIELQGSPARPAPTAIQTATSPQEGGGPDLSELTYTKAKEENQLRFGRAYWRAVLERAEMEISKASALSGVSANNIYTHLDTFGLREWWAETRETLKSAPTKGGKKSP